EPYTDEPATGGLQLLPETDFVNKLKAIYQHGFQVATHAIGDAANRFVLEAYRKVLPTKNALRWRLEHAQILHPKDLPIIGQYNIIPSVQPIHATSDMYWVKNRLGNRINHAYNYKTLLHTAGLVASGSDFPVEPINPLLGFYAAVSRKDVSGFPENGFRAHEALTRIQALKSMTIWAAYASFEEQEKGSIEPGKMADLTILDTDLLLHNIENAPKAKVLGTMVNGRMVYNAGLD
ncbi:MAG TPA: amidohydrolase family protein, partial [Chitinophagales bacterium]|nr:amidohydrolase family protein [Chitinophagales bacterium]